MPYIAGLHFFIALFFAVHAVRSGQPIFWLIILFSFPLLGSIVYFFAIYLPASRLKTGAKRAVAATIKVLDPERDLREAQEAFEVAPTAQNQIRLAQALLEIGQARAAADNYEACLAGPFASDPNIRLGAARSYIGCERYREAIDHLESIRKESPEFRKPEVCLALACAYAGVKNESKARELFEFAYQQYGGFEICAEYAIWTVQTGDIEKAKALQSEIELIIKRWPKHSKKINTQLIKRLNAAFAGLG